MMGSPVVGGSQPVSTGLQTQTPPMSTGDLLSDIFGALFDPKTAAMKMAEKGMTPEQFKAQMSGGNLSAIMKQQAEAKGNGVVSSLFGGKPLVDRGLYDLTPKGGDAQPDRVAELMTPAPKGNDMGRKPVSSLLSSEPTIGNYTVRPNLGNGPINIETPMPIVPPVAPQAQNMMIQPNAATSGQLPIAPPVVPPQIAGSVPPLPPEAVIAGAEPGVASAAAASSIPKDYKGGSTVLGGAAGSPNFSGNPIYTEFMNAVKAGGVTNPNALAAIAATGKSESGFNEGNVYGSWNDVGKPAGGVMSWRAERLDAMRKFVKDNGGDPNRPSPELQAKYLLAEDPELIKKLNAAKTPEEAQTLMNNAWRFKGYDKAGGERDRRIALARNLVGQFGDGKIGDIASGPGAPEQAGSLPAENTPASLLSRLSDFGAGLDMEGLGGGGKDYHGPTPPDAVPPRPGQYSPDAGIMKLMLMLLSPAGANMAQIPGIGQLMQRSA